MTEKEKLVGSGRKGRFGEGATRRWYDGIDNLKFYEGFFKDSIKPFLRDYMDCPAALVHIDCDLYSSTNDVFISFVGLWRNSARNNFSF